MRVSTHPDAMVRFLRSGIFWYIAPQPLFTHQEKPAGGQLPKLASDCPPPPDEPQAHPFLPHPRQQAEADFRRVLLIARQVPQQEAVFQAGA